MRLEENRERQPKKRFPKFITLKEGIIKRIGRGFTIAAFSALSVLGVADCASAISERPVAQERIQHSVIDWKRTHLVVVNGDTADWHKENASDAVKAGLHNKAAGIYVAGHMEDEPEGVERYEATYHGENGLEPMLRRVQSNSKTGDTILFYLTGHGAEGEFSLDRTDHIMHKTDHITHESLIDLLDENFKERKLVFVSDACFSANFVDELIENSKLSDIVAMSPGLENEETNCGYFAKVLWHAMRSGLDLDGNNISTIPEAFYYAMRQYQKVRQGTVGTYRETIPEVKRIGDVRDGLLMITSEACPACDNMEVVFNSTSVVLRGRVPFYKIDIENTDHEGYIPKILIRRNGKTIDSKVGSMGSREFRQLLRINGIGEEERYIKNLYAQGMYDSIVNVSGWNEMIAELGSLKTRRIVSMCLRKGTAKSVRENAVEILGEAGVSDHPGDRTWALFKMDSLLRDDELVAHTTWTLSHVAKEVDISEYPSLMTSLRRAFENEDSVNYGASVLGTAAKSRPEEIIPYLTGFLTNEEQTLRVRAASGLWAAAEVMDLSEHPEAVKGLVTALDDVDYVNWRAAYALREIAKNNPEKAGEYGFEKAMEKRLLIIQYRDLEDELQRLRDEYPFISEYDALMRQKRSLEKQIREGGMESEINDDN